MRGAQRFRQGVDRNLGFQAAAAAAAADIAVLVDDDVTEFAGDTLAPRNTRPLMTTPSPTPTESST